MILNESEAQFRELFETLPDVLVIYDKQSVIRHINIQGAQQLGYEVGALLGIPVSHLIEDSFILPHAPAQRESNEKGRQWTDAGLRRKDRTELPVEMMTRSVRFPGTGPNSLDCTGYDSSSTDGL